MQGGSTLQANVYLNTISSVLVLNTMIHFQGFFSPVNMTVGWKVHGMTKKVSWNVTKCSLFFNIVHLADPHTSSLGVAVLDIINNRYDAIIWPFQPTPVFVDVRSPSKLWNSAFPGLGKRLIEIAITPRSWPRMVGSYLWVKLICLKICDII